MEENCRVYISTLNSAKRFPFSDNEASLTIIRRILPESFSHDIYALGFQELVSTWEGCFPAIIEPLMKHLHGLILSYVNSHSPHRKYKLAGVTSTGAIGLVVLIDDSFALEDVAYSNYKCGLLNSSLKGSATICCTVRRQGQTSLSETLTFICSHLNANEGSQNAALRIANYTEIMSSCSSDLRSTPFKKGHMFFIGDLNFRVNGWHNMETDFSNKTVLKSILENYEELNQLRKSTKLLQGFTEAPIMFPPTYKYVTSKHNVYNNKRTPSWCDRVLFRKYKAGAYQDMLYDSIERFPELEFTDHQAVILDISIPKVAFDEPLEIETKIVSDNQITVGHIADQLIGYVGWGIYLKVHYGILFVLAVFILYKIF